MQPSIPAFPLPTTNQLIVENQLVGRCIYAALERVQRIGADAANPELLALHRDKIDEDWQHFVHNHQIIMRSSDAPDSQYIKLDIFSAVRDARMSALEVLANLAHDCEQRFSALGTRGSIPASRRRTPSLNPFLTDEGSYGEEILGNIFDPPAQTNEENSRPATPAQQPNNVQLLNPNAPAFRSTPVQPPSLLPPAPPLAQDRSLALRPKFNLPVFSGDILEWESFRDQFIAVVHENPYYTPAQKLQHLLSHLTGDAARLLDNTRPTDAAYEPSWSALTLRYGNPRILAAMHMRRLTDLKPARETSAAEIKRVLDTSRVSVRSLASLGKPIEMWDEWFLFLVTAKLDDRTRMDWEMSLINAAEPPPFLSLIGFLETRIQALQNADRRPERSALQSAPAATKARPNSRTVGAAVESMKSKCLACKRDHPLHLCPRFNGMSPEKRIDFVRSNNLCINCLYQGHFASKCRSSSRCRTCHAQHNSLLHDAHTLRPSTTSAAATVRTPNDSAASGNSTPASDRVDQGDTSTVAAAITPGGVLLATARVRALAPNGREIQLRALLDNGAQLTLVSGDAVRPLQLSAFRLGVTITGALPGPAASLHRGVNFKIAPLNGGSFVLPVTAVVSPNLLNYAPPVGANTQLWPHIQNLVLADPDFASPGPIDLILGSDVLNDILMDHRVPGPRGAPMAYESRLGYVLMGPTGGLPATTCSLNAVQIKPDDDSTCDLGDLLRRMWEIEEVQEPRIYSPDDEFCIRHFKDTHSRSESGRYIVHLPRKMEIGDLLHGSRPCALRMLHRIERRMEQQPEFADKYRKFMSDYISTGHMIPAEGTQYRDRAYFIPHHGVFKPRDPSQKLRVVLNASARAPSGHSLNSLLHSGPNAQDELWKILVRWGLCKFVCTADIVKMYRQIQLAPEEWHLQTVLFRFEESEPVQDFVIPVLTYGLTPSQFLSIQVLFQLVRDEGNKYPLAASIIAKNRYIDDFCFGADTVEELEKRKQDLTSLLQAGGFELAKWASNCQPDESAPAVVLGDKSGVQTLGLSWNPAKDTFSIITTFKPVPDIVTRRIAASDTATFYDPIGKYSPVSIRPKLFTQDSWIYGGDWDQPLPPERAREWSEIRKDLEEVAQFEIERFLNYTTDCQADYHGFCDASSRAYAAAIYLRAVHSNGAVTASLVIAKTRLAPIKAISIPKLELCGVLLLAKLISQVKSTLEIPEANIVLWTDARVALTWIQGHASRWKPFVANRVSKIQTLVDPACWRFVPGVDNPADLATRGITAEEFKSSRLWFSGPSWLTKDECEWPAQNFAYEPTADQEMRSAARLHVLTAARKSDTEWDLVTRFSELRRLVRVAAWIRIFADRMMACVRERGKTKHLERAAVRRFLSPSDLRRGLTVAVRASQAASFSREIEALSRGESLPSGSHMLNLKPVWDDQGCIRVGGRLHHASISYEERHPLIIAKNSNLARLLVIDAHQRTKHGGTQSTLHHVSTHFWILGARSFVRSLVRKCTTCIRFQGQTAQQLMGQLPPPRVRPQRPFLRAGVDFAGPILVRLSGGRGVKAQKGYICLFVCMATKAVHLEVAVDLSTKAFISAFRRFVSRRGHCAEMFSDNGTNFKGASTELSDMFQEASVFYGTCAALLANDGTAWTFNPPSAPHMGGLWEAAIKSTKHLLRRVIGEATLTFEELSTLLAQIEACLNSRPLSPISADPRDLTPLTPGHFLVGESLIAVPEPAAPDRIPVSDRYSQITRMRDDFWKRWRLEYLHQLRTLSKWTKEHVNLKIDDVVIVKDEITPPTKWILARVVEVFPDSQSKVRRVRLRTAVGTLERPTHKLVLLPTKPD